MVSLDRSKALSCLAALLKPIIRFCMRHALRFQDLSNAIKRVMIEVAEEEAYRRGNRITTSQLSAMTGLQRKDLVKLLEEREAGTELVLPARDLITKVVGQWQTDKKFTTSKKEPRVLSYDTGDDNFLDLVRSISTDLNPASVLREFERVGVVQRSQKGLRLVIGSFAPRGDLKGGFELVRKDVDDLISSVEDNVIGEVEVPHLHARTEYDGIREDALPEIKKWLLAEGHKFHEAARAYLSKFDEDVNPKPKYNGKRRKVVVTAFSRTENPDEN